MHIIMFISYIIIDRIWLLGKHMLSMLVISDILITYNLILYVIYIHRNIIK